MSNQYPGGLITKTPVVPNSISAPGVWSLSDQAAAQATNTWPFPRDPQFKNVTMLLHGDGSGGPTSLGMGAGASPTVTNFNADASTNNFNVVINGDAKSNNFTPYQAGYYSNYFDGTSSWNLASASSTAFAFGSGGAWAFEAWVFPTASMTDNWVMQTADSGNMRLRITTGGVLGWYSDTYGGGLNSSTVVPVNSWSHVAATYDGSTLRLFQNGVLTASLSSGSITNGTTAVSAYIGNWSGGSRAFNGYISNARIVKGSAVYTSAFTPSTTPLTAISGTSLLTCQSNRFIDNSSNAFTITVNGSPQVSPAQPFTLPSSVATYGSGYFDGSGDTLSLASQAALNFSTGDFTLEAWVYATTTLGDATCILTSVTSGGLMFGTNGAAGSGVWAIGRRGIAWDYSSSTVPVLNQWQHVAVCRSGTNVRIFINGVQSGTTGTNSTSYDLGLGGTVIGYQVNYMNGYFCSIRASNTALYTTTFTPPTVPFTAISGTQLLTTQYNGGGNNSGFKDSSQFNFPITRFGNTTQGTFTPYGSNWSSYLGTNGNYFTSGTNAALGLSTGDWTIEFFLNVTQFVDNQFLIDFRPSGSGGATQPLIYLTTAGTLLYFTASATRITSSTGVITAGTWAHIAVSRASGSTRMFVNGAQTGSTYTDSNDYGSSARFVNGTYGDAPGATNNNGGVISGYISNLRILKGTGLYTGSYTVPTSPLTAITNTSCLTFQSNRFVDNSSNSIAITPTGTPSVQRFSPFSPTTAYSTSVIGGSGYFDGSGDYLTAAQNAAFNLGTGAFTVEAWINLSALPSPSNGGIITLGNGAAGSGPQYCGWGLWVMTNGTINFERYDGTETVRQTSTAITLNQWNHIVAVRDGSSNFAIFINGVRGYSAASATTSYNNVNADLLYVGRTISGAGPSTNYLNGYIGDVRVVAGTAVYSPSSSTLTVPTAPLTAITNTSLLLSYTNAGILDNAMMNDLETVGNAQISTSVKKYGTGSMYFDGSGDRLYEPSNQNFNFGTGDFTIELWAYPISQGGHGNSNNDCLIDFRPAANGVYGTLYIFSSGTGIYWYVNSANRITGGAISNGVWTHIAICRSSGSTKLFLNGTQSGSTYTDANNYLVAPIMIGEFNDGAGAGNFNGYIDDLRITKGVARYTATFTVPDQAFPNG